MQAIFNSVGVLMALSKSCFAEEIQIFKFEIQGDWMPDGHLYTSGGVRQNCRAAMRTQRIGARSATIMRSCQLCGADVFPDAANGLFFTSSLVR